MTTATFRLRFTNSTEDGTIVILEHDDKVWADGSTHHLQHQENYTIALDETLDVARRLIERGLREHLEETK